MPDIKKIDRHVEICQVLNDIYARKNADYGDSFGKQFEEYGIVSSAIRIEDKFNRFKNLIKNKAQVKDESINDTLMDMANYCIMTLIELEKEKILKIESERMGLNVCGRNAQRKTD